MDETDEKRIKWYQGLVARANYLALDRPDIALATKACARKMSKTSQKDWEEIQRLARYLISRPPVVFWYPWQKWEYQPHKVNIYTDVDWAGCRRTRRSTSGGVI